jgi:hypothetical protein
MWPQRYQAFCSQSLKRTAYWHAAYPHFTGNIFGNQTVTGTISAHAYRSEHVSVDLIFGAGGRARSTRHLLRLWLFVSNLTLLKARTVPAKNGARFLGSEHQRTEMRVSDRDSHKLAKRKMLPLDARIASRIPGASLQHILRIMSKTCDIHERNEFVSRQRARKNRPIDIDKDCFQWRWHTPLAFLALDMAFS